ncbi:MAG: hypothetical protein WB424_03965 [Terracidiphilus sp.]
MNTFLDADLPHHFSVDLSAAAQSAAIEAANTGSSVLAVESIEIKSGRIAFIGRVPAVSIVADQMPSGSPTSARAIYTTWGSLLHPGETLGYLILTQPICLKKYEYDDPNYCRVAVSVPRSLTTIPPLNLGPRLCLVCRHPISHERIMALPGTRKCHDCKHKEEEERNAR